MYDYRKMNLEQRQAVVSRRQRAGQPWHRLEHRAHESQTYLITGACFEHRAILQTDSRRDEFNFKLLNTLHSLPDCELFAWCVLPNHYHFLARLDLESLVPAVRRLHNGTATQWNREDNAVGRKVWFSYCDRAMRSERHFWVTMNYIHANPVKHGYVKRAAQWTWSSVHEYFACWGRETLQEIWRAYPVLDYGRDWDV